MTTPRERKRLLDRVKEQEKSKPKFGNLYPYLLATKRVSWAQIEDLMRDTLLWLSSASAEERACLLAMQVQLADLQRILERRIEGRASAGHGKLWNETVGDFRLAFNGAMEARGAVVGRNLARLAAQFKSPLAGENSIGSASDRVSAPLKTRRARNKAQLKRDGIFFGALQAKLKGLKYCVHLDKHRARLPEGWISDGCPSCYETAYKSGHPWKKKIQDEKHRFQLRYDRTPLLCREHLIEETTRRTRS